MKGAKHLGHGECSVSISPHAHLLFQQNQLSSVMPFPTRLGVAYTFTQGHTVKGQILYYKQLDEALILGPTSSYINPKVISIFPCHPGWPPDQLNIDVIVILISSFLFQPKLVHQFALSNKIFNPHFGGVLWYMKHFQIQYFHLLIIGIKAIWKSTKEKVKKSSDQGQHH